MMYAYFMKGTSGPPQLTLCLPKRRVKRRRKPGRKRAADSKDPVHRVRESLKPGNAVHTILRVKADVGRLRRGPVLAALRRALVVVGVKADFRVVHFSIQHNHVHFLVEATGASALSKGMQAVAVSAARAINRVMRRRGKVFAYRFHSTVIRSPRQARSCLAYVLNNWRRHCEDERSLEARHCPVDPYSSAPSFPGWNQALNLAALPGWGGFTPIPGAAPTTWLLREGWLRAGDPLDMWSTPGPPH